MGWYTGYPKAWLILILPNLQNLSGVQRFLLLDWSILWKSDVKVCTDLVIWSQMHPSLTLEKGLVSSILPGAYILPFLSYSLHMNLSNARTDESRVHWSSPIHIRCIACDLWWFQEIHEDTIFSHSKPILQKQQLSMGEPISPPDCIP